MPTTITGLFADDRSAADATARLTELGVPAEQVQTIDAGTRGVHGMIAARCTDTRRAILLGVLFGGLGGALSGGLFGSGFGTWSAIGTGAAIGAAVIALGGALLGLWIGRSTASQIRDEMENQVASGTVLVSMTTDDERDMIPMAILAPLGGTSMVSTSTTFTAGILPTAPESPGSPESHGPQP